MDKDIKKLTERFMAGQTSVEEEETLAEYFRSHDVSDEWKAYKEMFAWFDKGMPLDEKKPVRRASIRSRIIAFATAAAAIALILTTVLPRVANNIGNNNFTPDAQNFCEITALAEDSITNDTAKVAEPVKKTTRKVLNKHRYSPPHPKVYLAMEAQDSINKQADLLAEQELNKIFMEQEKMLQEIKLQYEQQNRDIEIIMAAMQEEPEEDTEDYIYY